MTAFTQDEARETEEQLEKLALLGAEPWKLGQDAPTPAGKHKLLNEFKMAAQSLVDLSAKDRDRPVNPDELQRHIDWFKELLA